MPLLSALFLGLVVFITSGVWYYLRILAPYSKLPSCYTFFMHIILWILKKQSLQLNLLSKMEEVCKRYEKEGMFVTWINGPMVVVFGEKAVKKIMKEPTATNKPKFEEVFKYILRNVLFLSSGEEYKKRKMILKPAFQFEASKRRIPIMNKYSRNLVKKLSTLQNNSNDVLYILKDSALRMVLEAYLNMDEHFQKSSIVIEHINKLTVFVTERILKPWLHLDITARFFPESWKCIKKCEEVYDILEERLEAIKENMLRSNENNFAIKPKFLAEFLIKEHLQDPSFTMDDVMREIFFMFVASFNRTAVTLMWCLHLLGHHQEIQENVFAELKDMNEDLCHEDLRKMEYTECVIKETLRLYTTTPIIGRHVTKELQCGQYKIPKGSDLVILLSVFHKNADLYPDPEKFYPERFRKSEDGSGHLYSAPFAEGHRPCPGKEDAMNQLKIMIAHVIRSYRVVSLDSRKDVQVSWEIVLHSAKPLRMQFIPRHALSDADVH